MPLPTVITDLSVTAGSNSPAGTDSIGTSADDYIRAHAAFLAQVRDGSKYMEAGTATAPSAAFAGDTNTGMYSPGADHIAITAGGKTSLIANGRVYVGGNSDTFGLGISYSPARLLTSESFFIGASNSATPDLIFSNYGGVEVFRMSVSGIFTNPANTQPAFYAHTSAATTSNGATLSTYTETFDQGGVFNPTTGVFTAPVTGWYLLTFTGTLIMSATASGSIRCTTSEGHIAGACSLVGTSGYGSGSGLVKMTAGATASLLVSIEISTGTISAQSFAGRLFG